MAAKRPARRSPRPSRSGPTALKPLLRPVIEPVLTRLDRLEALLEEMKGSMDVQFKRTAAIQAQLDQVLAARAKNGG